MTIDGILKHLLLISFKKSLFQGLVDTVARHVLAGTSGYVHSTGRCKDRGGGAEKETNEG